MCKIENDWLKSKVHEMNGGQPIEGDEELGAVSAWANVENQQKVRLGVTESEVLIFELFSADGLTTDTVSVSEIATLSHEFWNNAADGEALVIHNSAWGISASFTGGERLEVSNCIRKIISEKTDGDASNGLATNSDIEIDLVGDVGKSVVGASCDVSAAGGLSCIRAAYPKDSVYP